MQPLAALDAVTVVRPGGTLALRDLCWTIRDGETWAVVGPVGAGKTTLAETLLGRYHLAAGSITWPLLERLRAAGRAVGWPSDVVRLVTFKEESHLFSYGRHYYQQRFNFIEPADDLTLNEFLRTGTTAADTEVQSVADQLGIGGLRELSFLKLSNGQARRARIARALLSRPELLILDDPFLGIDAEGRGEIAHLLGELVRNGLRLLLIARPDDVPDWVTHVLELDHGTAHRHGPRHLQSSPLAPRADPERPFAERADYITDPLIEMHCVTVSYAGRPILQDISWTVRAGERWAVLGSNGSGKTTLLSLICGDHPQAYSNDVRVFGRRRGSGESIWDVKRPIGLVSPELHLYFTEPLTAEQTAATGFFDTLVPRPTSPEQVSMVRELFEQFGIAALAECPFARLSTGQQRLVLLLRALVKRPLLVVLDEPFQGLDERSIAQARDWLDKQLRPEQTLIFVSHYAGEVPRTVTRRLRLEAGRAVAVE